MFLLILEYDEKLGRIPVFTFQYVSINTISHTFYVSGRSIFTFQYVSINTESGNLYRLYLKDLHSNMFLLIHTPPEIYETVKNIYIPICFY